MPVRKNKQVTKSGEKITINRELRRVLTVLVIALFIAFLLAQSAIAEAIVKPLGRALNIDESKLDDFASAVTATSKRIFVGGSVIVAGMLAFTLLTAFVSLPVALIVGGSIAVTGVFILNWKPSKTNMEEGLNWLGNSFKSFSLGNKN